MAASKFKGGIKTHIIKVTDKVVSGEVDYEMYNDVFGKANTNKIYNTGHPTDFLIDESKDDKYPINIVVLESILDKLKRKGANYVSIHYNCDHPDYTFNGISIHEATTDEIETKKAADIKKAEIEHKRASLIKQLNELPRV